MSNFVETFKKGQSSAVKGIPFGKGLENITMHTNGIIRGRIYGVAGPEKSGKSTFADYAFILQPFLFVIEFNKKIEDEAALINDPILKSKKLSEKINIEWDYYSFEISRINKEFDFATYFIHHDFGVTHIKLPEGVTKEGQNVIELSSDYLKGYLIDDNGNSIKIKEVLLPMIISVYENRIVPLFGEYGKNGEKISKGYINFKDIRENPTGIYKDLLRYAATRGKLIEDTFGNPIRYIPNNPSEIRIVIVDHLRKLKPERQWQMKQTIDKMTEYMVILRDLLGYVFVPILHTNRNLASVDKMTYYKGDIYPTSDDLKDSGNLGEDCNYLFTTFNPNDDKYSLKEHFKLKLRDSKDNILYPNLKTIHLVSSRHCEFPKHYKVNMVGNLKKFEKF